MRLDCYGKMTATRQTAAIVFILSLWTPPRTATHNFDGRIHNKHEAIVDPFRTALADWGVFIDIHTPLTSNDRASFIECLRHARAHMATINQRNVLIDLRSLDVIQDSDRRVRAYVSVVEHLEAQRVAVVVSSPSAAARMREALGAVGMIENSRVLVQNIGVEGALRPAIRWVSGEQDGGDEAPSGNAAER